jgi:hypothetical protein
MVLLRLADFVAAISNLSMAEEKQTTAAKYKYCCLDYIISGASKIDARRCSRHTSHSEQANTIRRRRRQTNPIADGAHL